jgi:transcriptional regulator with PAS, ATPase and Fis domain
MQVQLLRVIETKQFSRVGGNDVVSSDFRVVCATNRDLEAAVKEGAFREDLYYRMNVFTIFIPPLRERRADIPVLAQYFTNKYAAVMSKPINDLAPATMDMLVQYDWPGNVRELENVIERAMVLAKPPTLQPADLPFQMGNKTSVLRGDTLEAIERIHIENILQRNNWNISRSAETLDIDRVTLYNKIAKFGLKKP